MEEPLRFISIITQPGTCLSALQTFLDSLLEIRRKCELTCTFSGRNANEILDTLHFGLG